MKQKEIKIGENIIIHSHISDSEMWFITIYPLKIKAQMLCKKSCTPAEIARHVNVLLHQRLNVINALIEDVLPLT